MDAFASQHEKAEPFDNYVNSDGETDTLWPDHCVADTQGAELHKDINIGNCLKDFYIFKKGTDKDHHPYSGFGETELKDFLQEREISEVYIVGLATDYCVKDTALDAVGYGFDTTVIIDGCRAISSDLTDTLEKFYNAGIKIIESSEFDLVNALK
jgi:nicotinamidase/pyrazinamidase